MPHCEPIARAVHLHQGLLAALLAFTAAHDLHALLCAGLARMATST